MQLGQYTTADQERLWQWLFSGNWAGTDNTPQGAGKRILFALHSEENMHLVLSWIDDCSYEAGLALYEDFLVPTNNVYKIELLKGN